MLPKIIGVGTFVRDPEIRYLANGKSVTTFSLAFNKKYKTSDGQQKEIVCFLECSTFGALGEKVVIPYLKKGSKTYIVGELKLDQWQDQNGGKRSKHTVVIESIEMLDSRSNNGQTTRPAPEVKIYDSSLQGEDIDSSEIPF